LLDQQASIQQPFIPEVSRNEVVNVATTSSVDLTHEQQEYNSRNKVINLIFQLHNEGISHGQIVDRLKELEIPTFTGKGDWRIQTIAKFCKDMASTGNTKLNAKSDE
ncbi:MAG: recombinase family protein, partial [Desulfatirhabdiaceae bacterium]